MALALDLTNKLLELTPTHTRALGNRQYYQDQLKNIKQEDEIVKKKGDDESENVEMNGVKFYKVMPPFSFFSHNLVVEL